MVDVHFTLFNVTLFEVGQYIRAVPSFPFSTFQLHLILITCPWMGASIFMSICQVGTGSADAGQTELPLLPQNFRVL